MSFTSRPVEPKSPGNPCIDLLHELHADLPLEPHRRHLCMALQPDLNPQ
jgi:hypothetical protein